MKFLSSRKTFLLIAFFICLTLAPVRNPAKEVEIEADFRFAPSPVKLIASGVSFKGERCGYGEDVKNYPEEIYRLVRINENVLSAPSWSYPYDDGFRFYRTKSQTCTNFLLNELAKSKGWLEGENSGYQMISNAYSLWKIDGKLWMGSHGIGILVFDPKTEKFSRYDTQLKADLRKSTFIRYADEDYLMFGLTNLTVYSVKKKKWRQLISIPRRAFTEFGYTPEAVRPYVSLPYDHRVYATQPFVRLDANVAPNKVSASDDGKTYLFERNFSKDDSDPKTVFKITKAELAKIFN